jgi:hypothetical protein
MEMLGIARGDAAMDVEIAAIGRAQNCIRGQVFERRRRGQYFDPSKTGTGSSLTGE